MDDPSLPVNRQPYHTPDSDMTQCRNGRQIANLQSERPEAVRRLDINND